MHGTELEQRELEAVQKRSGDGFAVARGPVVHYVRIFVRKIPTLCSLLLLSFLDRLDLDHNLITSLPDSLGLLLANLTEYGI